MEVPPAIPNDVQNLLQRLIFLEMIPDDGSKLNLSSKCFDSPDSWLGGLKRRFQREDRGKSIEYIHDLSDQLSMILEKYRNSEWVIAIILAHLEKSLQGIRKLLTTYETDPDTISRLRVILENLEYQQSQMHVTQ